MVRFPKRNLSFVRREGRLTSGQENAISSHWPTYGLHAANGPLDRVATFGRQAPCILEIGFGTGDSLSQQAQAHPEINFIGIEVYRPGVGSLLATLANEQIENIRIYNEDAVNVLEQAIGDNSLDVVQIFFPDPWPKRRHHKRRLMQPAFIELLHKKLKFKGLLHSATDWQHYADHIKQVMAGVDTFTTYQSTSTTTIPLIQRPLTKFEQRGSKLGHAIHDLRYVNGQ